MRGPTASVIVCTYRREASLRNLLGDLATQERQPLEIVLVDQTPEHEEATTRVIAGLGPLARVVRQETPNLPQARNRGVSEARGDVVVFLDDDVRLPPTFLSGIVRPFAKPYVDGVAPLVEVPSIPSGEDVVARYRLRGDWRQADLIAVDSVIGVCMAFRRAVVIELGGFDPFLGLLHPSASGEDLEFTRRFTRSGHRLYLAPRIVARHEADWPGGCDVRRSTESEPARRSMTYLVLKEHGSLRRFRWNSLVPLLRAHVLRRDVICSPLRLARSPATLARDIRAVRTSWAEHVATG